MNYELQKIIDRLEFRGKDPTFTGWIEAYLNKLQLTPSAQVLMLGCGTGVEIRILAGRPVLDYCKIYRCLQRLSKNTKTEDAISSIYPFGICNIFIECDSWYFLSVSVRRFPWFGLNH